MPGFVEWSPSFSFSYEGASDPSSVCWRTPPQTCTLSFVTFCPCDVSVLHSSFFPSSTLFFFPPHLQLHCSRQFVMITPSQALPFPHISCLFLPKINSSPSRARNLFWSSFFPTLKLRGVFSPPTPLPIWSLPLFAVLSRSPPLPFSRY